MGRMSDGALPLPPSFGGPLFWSDKGENPGQETWRIEFNFYSRSALLRPLISASAIWCFPLQFQANREYLRSQNGNPKALIATTVVADATGLRRLGLSDLVRGGPDRPDADFSRRHRGPATPCPAQRSHPRQHHCWSDTRRLCTHRRLAFADVANLVGGVSHCRRTAPVLHRFRNGVRAAHPAGKRSGRASGRRTRAQHRGDSAHGAGPGAIAATILLAGHARGNLLLIVALVAIVILVAACCVTAFDFAGRISRLLGMTGNIVLSRLLGVLLAALAVQYVVDGVRAILSG